MLEFRNDFYGKEAPYGEAIGYAAFRPLEIPISRFAIPNTQTYETASVIGFLENYSP